MEFNFYQQKTSEYWRYPDAGNNFLFPTLGLAGEVGEVVSKIKKLMRDKGVFTPTALSAEDTEELVKELGDVLFYLSAMAKELHVNLSDVAQVNLDKIEDRRRRGTLLGSGDNR